MKSRTLIRLLIVSLATFGAIPAISSASAIKQKDCKPEPLAVVTVPTIPGTKDRRTIPVQDRWRSPHRNLSTASN